MSQTIRREVAERITIDPKVMVGKPVIKGTRVPVALVLAKLAANPDLGEFFLDYPELTIEDVKASLSYASTLVAEQVEAPGGPPVTATGRALTAL